MANSPMVGAGHHVRTKTNVPVIGILGLPIPGSGDDDYLTFVQNDLVVDSKKNEIESVQYIQPSHVQFLESAGARVAPINPLLSNEEIKKILEQVNGVYIPGGYSGSNHEVLRATKTIL